MRGLVGDISASCLVAVFILPSRRYRFRVSRQQIERLLFLYPKFRNSSDMVLGLLPLLEESKNTAGWAHLSTPVLRLVDCN